MKTATNLSDLFTKLNDLKHVFKYGEMLIPIIQNIIDFMRETVPLLENINNSITDTAAKIPKAANQIQKVTSATEVATTEILDVVDELTNDVFTVMSLLENITKAEAEREKIFTELKPYLDKVPLELLNKFESFFMKDNNPEKIQSIFANMNDKIYRITLSLQVQDITAQQLAAVNHLIESVQERLTSLLSHFENANIKEPTALNIEVTGTVSFDPNARYEDRQEEQNSADILVNEHFVSASQDEIDKLFAI